MKWITATAILVLTIGRALAGDLPDSSKTPGKALDAVPDAQAAECLTKLMKQPVKAGQSISHEMLCHDLYTTCIRNVTKEEKDQVYKNYSLPGGDHTGVCSGSEGCEIDHLISLEIGGANDEKNLWPQPYQGTWNAHLKDQLEKHFQKMICANQIPLAEAQKEISTNWIEAYKKYIQ
jgi:hypothetical protein